MRKFLSYSTGITACLVVAPHSQRRLYFMFIARHVGPRSHALGLALRVRALASRRGPTGR